MERSRVSPCFISTALLTQKSQGHRVGLIVMVPNSFNFNPRWKPDQSSAFLQCSLHKFQLLLASTGAGSSLKLPSSQSTLGVTPRAGEMPTRRENSKSSPSIPAPSWTPCQPWSAFCSLHHFFQEKLTQIPGTPRLRWRNGNDKSNFFFFLLAESSVLDTKSSKSC